jgi:hypothetical protein
MSRSNRPGMREHHAWMSSFGHQCETLAGFSWIQPSTSTMSLYMPQVQIRLPFSRRTIDLREHIRMVHGVTVGRIAHGSPTGNASTIISLLSGRRLMGASRDKTASQDTETLTMDTREQVHRSRLQDTRPYALRSFHDDRKESPGMMRLKRALHPPGHAFGLFRPNTASRYNVVSHMATRTK